MPDQSFSEFVQQQPPQSFGDFVASIPGMEKLGALPAAGKPPAINMRQSGETEDVSTMPVAPMVGGPMAAASRIAQMIPSGIGSAIRGGERMADPSLKEKAAGASQVLRGTMRAAAPLALPYAAVTAPLRTAAGLVASSGAGMATEAGLNASGVAPEFSALGGDVAGIAVGGLAAKYAPRVGEAIAPNLRASAEKSYARALGPTTRENKLLTERQVAPGLIDRGVMAGTRKGLQAKVGAAVQDFGQQIGDAIDALPEKAALPLDAVIGAIDKAGARQFMVDSPNGPLPATPESGQGLGHLEQLKQIIQAGRSIDDQGNPVVDSRFLRTLRQNWDRSIDKSKGFTTNDLVNNAKIAAYRSASDAVREQFAQAYPDINALNKQFSFWKNTQKVIDATVNRMQSQSKPLTRQILRGAAAGAGLVKAGPLGAAVDMAVTDSMMGAIQSTGWRTTSAFLKDRLAKAFLAGDAGQVNSISAQIAAGTARQSDDEPRLISPEQQPQF